MLLLLPPPPFDDAARCFCAVSNWWRIRSPSSPPMAEMTETST